MSLVKVKYICLGTLGNVARIQKWNEKKKKNLVKDYLNATT